MRSLGVAIVVLILSSAAWADATSDARDQHRQGLALYDLGRFAEAAAKIEGAFVLRDEPGLLLDAGLAWRRAGNFANAVRVYRGYLRRATPGSAMIDSISQCLEDLQNAARRANPRGCNRDPIPIAWDAAAPGRSPPARAATAAPAAGDDDDAPSRAPAQAPAPREPAEVQEPWQSTPPPRAAAPASPVPRATTAPSPPAPRAAAAAPAAAVPVPREPAQAAEAAPPPARTVYDPWHGKITRAAPPETRTSREPAPFREPGSPSVAPGEPPAARPSEPVIADVTSAPEPPRPRAPYYKTAWFWTTMVLAAGTVVGVAVGIGFGVPSNASSRLPTFGVKF
jgi:hypothetical protein